MTAERHNAGKPPMHYLLTFASALRALADLMRDGEGEYPKYNYLKGAPVSEHVDSLLRHLTTYWETGDKTHAVAVAWNALRLATEVLNGKVQDDRANYLPTFGPVVNEASFDEQKLPNGFVTLPTVPTYEGYMPPWSVYSESGKQWYVDGPRIIYAEDSSLFWREDGTAHSSFRAAAKWIALKTET